MIACFLMHDPIHGKNQLNLETQGLWEIMKVHYNVLTNPPAKDNWVNYEIFYLASPENRGFYKFILFLILWEFKVRGKLESYLPPFLLVHKFQFPVNLPLHSTSSYFYK